MDRLGSNDLFFPREHESGLRQRTTFQRVEIWALLVKTIAKLRETLLLWFDINGI